MIAHNPIWDGPVDQPVEPTDTAPGSAERIEVYRRRVAAGQQLHHPRDARYRPRLASPDLAGEIDAAWKYVSSRLG